MGRQRSAKDQHRDAVLALLHRGHELTRGEIAEQLGLTRTTVSDLLVSLRGDGIVTVSHDRPSDGRGRPAEVLRIHPGAVRYIGIEFTHIAVTVCLANAAAEIVASGTTRYEHGTGWESRVQAGVALVHALTIDDVHLAQLAGIGIGLPGPNSASWQGFHRSDRIAEPFHLVRARIREVFGEEFAAPVLVDHHIRFAAQEVAAAEGRVDCSLVYLRLSTGSGGAVLGDGSAWRGRNLLAGEIGHMIVDHSESAQMCRCGRRGCLETVASHEAVLTRWRSLNPAAVPAADDACFEQLRAAVAAGEEPAISLVGELAETVGRVVGIASLVMDPDQIVIAGEVGALLAPVLPVLREAACRETLGGETLQIRIVTTDTEQGARGAITVLRAQDSLFDLRTPDRLSPVRSVDLAGGTRVR
ncbi:hypothetical protein CFK39_08820 [Brachybacterium avium]|uniref:HTH marR-type domain-containing protein n=1 Tax=Brachybacterium avium TaxID=2017485 RepID=A0A220UDW7_9MICO|nr:ROK family transcriptional regulator [Brachybacterium avium]ASK65913.1 hypothetical protein CFK39_08820 [Brachybacterium avium]